MAGRIPEFRIEFPGDLRSSCVLLGRLPVALAGQTDQAHVDAVGAMLDACDIDSAVDAPPMATHSSDHRENNND